MRGTFFGTLLYWAYYYPRGWLRKLRERNMYARAGDFIEEKRMQEHASLLRAPLFDNEPVGTLSFVSGKIFWHQTIFCIFSFLQNTTTPVKIKIYDDGTLTTKQQQTLLSFYKWIEIVPLVQVEEQLEAFLPRDRFPTLRARRDEYPHLRKLIDIHAGSSGWKLVMDSDMLFFDHPKEIVRWLEAPSVPCHLVDIETSYGYTTKLLEDLASCILPERVNVGITGLKSDEIDWEMVEMWCREMIREEGTHYTQEQAIVAMLIARTDGALALSEARYKVLPQKEEVIHPTAVLHHYVAASKPWYYRYGWKHFSSGA